ncbi:hypothetical protein TSH100_12935 [Azospirillum sp. TSH100]|uniref:Uncharacterized protein n=5 Tax=Azospirillaceae TaxID=2829815 RepID=A0A2B8B7L8_9PROT|nr:hypothetical protein FZ942_04545 [Azospirillum lipoferum]NUA98881.1 hypothetical protein [Azospirillum melinis]PGH53342.1 hypothetical protein CRT60_25965 [Azospirillum palustre]PWC50906.1 hypothetical protein TSA6c_34340 [Azospirillum sp. TSA6c]PWC75145.1 hypothetical protein TSH64_09370 [Azospirillum sp. TSH64]PWC86657.1 hypothetical protein TSH100_12935 [Azospirillum sp. TSH100]
MMKPMRNLTRPTPRPLQDWPADMTRTEGGWYNRPGCPLVPRFLAEGGFLRDRLSMIHGSQPLPNDLSDGAVDATLRLMLRRGK